MSGIAGIFNLDGAPVNQTVLRRITDFIRFRGPDRAEIWVDDNIGLSHTLLAENKDSGTQRQPFTLDGNLWIVADARVDDQDRLIRQLTDRGERVGNSVADVELLLRAYRTWGENCVDYILGDFAFAIWDKMQKRLFCGRDHLGVKSLFYARTGETIIFSNTLDCIRQHPGVSDKLNDVAIADFLLFEMNQDLKTTFFSDIQRIPPAHWATWSKSDNRIVRYWTMPIDEPVFFKRSSDYTDRFKELLDTSVRDRLRTNNVAILMSGGMDSSALAATACKALSKRSLNPEIQAFTTIIDGLDGNERHYSRLVSDRLGIKMHVRDRGANLIDPDWYQRAIHTPEPQPDPTNLAGDREEFRAISRHSSVLFYGEGPDNALLYEWKPYVSYLVQNRKFIRLIRDIGGHMFRHRRIPLIPSLPRILRARANPDRWNVPFPTWLNEGFASRMHLRDRWEEMKSPKSSTPAHFVRPRGYSSFQTHLWESTFSCFDAGQTRVPVETRHPFVDLRLLRYMLAVPALPWCRRKYLLRRSMRSELPDEVLRRAKSPVIMDPYWVGARQLGLPRLRTPDNLREYVDCDKVPGEVGDNMVSFRVNFRPFALSYWLCNLWTETDKTAAKENSQDGHITTAV